MGGISINRLKERERGNGRITLRRLTEAEYRAMWVGKENYTPTMHRASGLGRLTEYQYKNLDRLLYEERTND